MAQQRIGVGQAQDPGHLVLLLEHQPVAGPAGHLVQDVPCVQYGLLRGPRARPRPGRDPGRGHRMDRLRVAQAAPGLLEIGLQQEREFAAAGSPLLVQCLQFGQPGAGARTPVRQDSGAQVAGQPGVTGDVPGVQQAERDPQVLAGHLPCLGRPAHGMVEVGARVPDGVPDPVGECGDARPPVVQEQHVEVAAREQFAPPVAAHRHQRHSRLGPQQRGQPPVRARGAAAAVGRERGEAPRPPGSRTGPAGRFRALPAHAPATRVQAALRGLPARAPRCGPAPPCPPGCTRPCRRRSGPSARP